MNEESCKEETIAEKTRIQKIETKEDIKASYKMALDNAGCTNFWRTCL